MKVIEFLFSVVYKLKHCWNWIDGYCESDAKWLRADTHTKNETQNGMNTLLKCFWLNMDISEFWYLELMNAEIFAVGSTETQNQLFTWNECWLFGVNFVWFKPKHTYFGNSK